jgi:hypothetical protein
MEIKLQHGFDRLLFGMTQKYVETLYGKPNRVIKDEEDNIIYVYNQEKMKLTFYADEDFRLGYITISNPAATLLGSKALQTVWDLVQDTLALNKIDKYDQHEEDGVQIYFNEENWLMLYVDYNEVVKIEIGAIINDKDEFNWKFNE